MRNLALVSALFACFSVPVSAANDTVGQGEKAREREIRSLQKEVSKLEKRYDKLLKRCQGDEYNRADARACNTAQVTYQDVQQLKKRIGALQGRDD